MHRRKRLYCIGFQNQTFPHLAICILSCNSALIPPQQRKKMAQPEEVEISSGDSGGAGPSQPMIVLSVKGEDGEVLHFKVHIHKPIKRLLVNYCQKKLLDLKLLRFVINQRDFDHRKTPAELGLKDKELIVVLLTNYGG